MNNIGSKICAAVLLSGILLTAAEMDKTVSIQIGPDWPRSVKGTAWNASATSGVMFEKMVGISGGIDFLWKTDTRDSTLPASGTTTTTRKITKQKEQYYMFPAYAALEVDPVPTLIVHPVVSIAAGVNMLVFGKDTLDRADPDLKLKKADDSNGFYIGPFVKLSIDGVYYFGETVGAKLGFSYRWSTPTKKAEEGWDYERKMSGIGLHAGFNFKL
jgi:hypothetical protein